MRILNLYNQYRSFLCGEERAVLDNINLMEKKGIETKLIMPSSRGLEKNIFGKLRAFICGIYSYTAYKNMVKVCKEFNPDIVHVNNLYPLLSPSVLVATKRENIPTVMTVHNYQLTCPIANHLRKSNICDLCVGGHEFNCILHNCRGNIFESIAYAIRSAVARKLRLFHDNISIFIVPTVFTKMRLIEAGFSEERIVLLKNLMVVNKSLGDISKGQYVGFAGRMSPEKGVDILIAAAKINPDVTFQLAGVGPSMPELLNQATSNTKFLGLLEGAELEEFFKNARFIVVPSLWYEMCPLVISQAVSHGLPVIASRIGGLSEIVEDGITGLLFNPGDYSDLSEKIKMLWNNPDLCRRMGRTGYEKSVLELGEDVYFDRLMKVYEKAINANGYNESKENVCRVNTGTNA